MPDDRQIIDPDNPQDGDPDAVSIEGELIKPDDAEFGDDEIDDFGSDDDLVLGDKDNDETPAGTRQDDGQDYKTRYGDAVRYNQQLQNEVKRLKTLENDAKALEAAGLSMAELKKLVPGQSADGGSPDAQPGGDFVSKRDFQAAVQNVGWVMAKNNFVMNNPAFGKNSSLNEMLDFQATKIVREEMARNGAMVSSPDVIYREAAKKVKKLVNSFKDDGKKTASELRKKVKGQSADLGGKGSRKPPASDEDETDDPRKDYINQHNQTMDRISKTSRS